MGLVIKREELVNPSRHSLHLWLRPLHLNQGTLSLTTYLRSSSFVEQSHSPPTGPEIQPWVSKGSLKVSEVRIRRESRETAVVLTLDSEEWQGVSIAPGETLVLEWLARTQAEVRDCRLPYTQNLTMSWTSQPQGAAPVLPNFKIGGVGGNHNLLFAMRDAMEKAQIKPERPTSPSTFHQTVANEWSLLGAEISGRWSRDLLVSYSFLSKEDATQSFLGHNIAMGFIEALSTIGESVIDPLQFSCQGVFR